MGNDVQDRTIIISEADRRRLQLEVTPKGVKVLRETGPTIESSVANALKATSDEDIATTRAFLERLVAAL